MEARVHELNHSSMKEKTVKKDSAAAAESEDGAAEDDKRKRAASGSAATIKRGGGGDASMKSCQAENCSADLSDAKTYHRRHKVCEVHAKAQVVVVAGTRQRFCQQCSRFHELSEFDETKRSCRRRLAGHNERRRKNPSDTSQAEGSDSSRMRGNNGQVDDRGRIPMSVQENANYKHFHVQ